MDFFFYDCLRIYPDAIFYLCNATADRSIIHRPVLLAAILCLIPRTTVTSLITPKDTRCKTHPLCVNPGVPF